MALQRFTHKHPLVFVGEWSTASEAEEEEEEEEEEARCSMCEKLVDGPCYCCLECKFYIHKHCAEVKLSLQIKHVFHPQHVLTLLPKSPYRGQYGCDFCGWSFWGFVYHCDACEFDLDINCALLEISIAENFPRSLHKHPLIFVKNHNEEVLYDCAGCKKRLSGPIYHCLHCSKFYLHKECAELPLEINHPSDSEHPLTLLPNPLRHPEKCSCYLCKIKWDGFVYCCSLCKVELTPEDVFAPRTITVESHRHQWMLLSRQMSFFCDFCGTSGGGTPYVCTACDLLVHKNCISLPRDIMLTRHHHVISHSYRHQQNCFENWKCRICYDKVNIRYGCYYCSTSDCNYIAHVNCATHKDIWDGTIALNNNENGGSSAEGLDESMNLITDVIEEISIGEDMVAIEIKHVYHDHNLVLTFSGEIKDDNNCDGCMGPISTPFYSCDICKFFLHKSCAELPRKKRHSFHKHILTLTNKRNKRRGRYSARCNACYREHHGFRYRCLEKGCWFSIDIQCSLLSDTLKHPSHKHLLFLVHNYRGKCSGCPQEMHGSLAYRCVERCDFILDLDCATLPLTAWFKYDEHLLTLTYFDDSNSCQHYCDLCEERRDPKHWFYYCADCDNSLHVNCALGDLPLIKLGSELKYHIRHPHPLTFVKNIWNCPPCKVCGELCNGQTLTCKDSKCNSSFHWLCFWSS